VMQTGRRIEHHVAGRQFDLVGSVVVLYRQFATVVVLGFAGNAAASDATARALETSTCSMAKVSREALPGSRMPSTKMSPRALNPRM